MKQANIRDNFGRTLRIIRPETDKVRIVVNGSSITVETEVILDALAGLGCIEPVRTNKHGKIETEMR